MNESIMKQMGLGDMVDNIKKGICPFCGKKINSETEFRDSLSITEYYISGLCQQCQDDFFGEGV